MRRSIVLLACVWLLAACGASAGDQTGAPPLLGGAASDTTIARQAECAFPDEMQVGRAATVRFSIFTPGNRPDRPPDASTATESLNLPQRPDADVWVAVDLRVNGQPVDGGAAQFQQLSDQRNIWLWQVTPTSAAPVTLQPIVNVEFRDAQGNVVERRADVWTETYVVENVAGSGPLGIATAWLGDSVQELITGAIGALLLGAGRRAKDSLGRRMGRRA